jgi:L-ascorbate metabolism protein UlaG (beta-lactamase superfamily)
MFRLTYEFDQAAAGHRFEQRLVRLTAHQAGDTGLFPDMKFISECYKPDLVLIPVGGSFTMDPDDAAHAARTRKH